LPWIQGLTLNPWVANQFEFFFIFLYEIIIKKKKISLIPLLDDREKILVKSGGALPFVKGKRLS